MRLLKLKRRELALLLPCLGLLAVGTSLGRWRMSKPQPSLQVTVGAGQDELSDVGVKTRMSAFNPLPGLTGPRLRWYFNCRIEGTLNRRPRLFYEVAQSAPLLAAGMNGLEEGTDSMSVPSSDALGV